MKRTTRSRTGTPLEAVCAELERLAPAALAQSWDNVGLLAGDLRARTKRVLLCIDLMPPVADEAIEQGAGLVIAYHPPIFKPISRLALPTTGMEAGVFRCIAAGAAVYSLHTALDAAPGGTNDVIADLCGMVGAAPLEQIPSMSADDGDPPRGMGRVGALRQPTTLAKLARKLKRRTGARCVSVVGEPTHEVKRAIVVVGAAGSLPFQAPLGPGDVVVTGEIRHHDALHIQRTGANAIALSHWSSERPALSHVAKRLVEALPKLEVRLSDRDCEPFVRV